MSAIAKWLFSISPRETSSERRGFRGEGAARQRVDRIGGAFLAGYNAALQENRLDSLVPRLDQLESSDRGFAYEGAAMGLALLDWCTPWNRGRLAAFLRGPGDPHTYMVHVGAGWVLARVPGSVEKFLNRFDPLLRWLAMDGYGFHEGFFHWPRYCAGRPPPARVKGYARRAFDLGLGRSLWFIEGADVARISNSIAALAPERQPDLWSGTGLASVYAGEATAEDLRTLRDAAGRFHPHLAQGAAFAAKARQRAGNLSSYHDVACRILCNMSSLDAAQATDDALENLPADDVEPAFETWRRRIQQRFAQPAEARR